MESGGSLPPTDLVLQALHAIRKQIEELGAEQRQTNQRLDQTNQRLEGTNERLERLENRVTAGFIETNTKLADLSGRVGALSGRVDQLGARLENVFTGPLGQGLREVMERVRSLEERSAGPGEGAHESQAPYGDKK